MITLAESEYPGVPDDISDLDEVDRQALWDSLAICRASSEGRSDQLDSMLKDRTWYQVASFASFCCQSDALRLKPFEVAPLHVHDPDLPRRGEEAAAELLGRMLDAGISRYNPNPRRALAEAAAAEENQP
jgi:hypothetical protein